MSLAFLMGGHLMVISVHMTCNRAHSHPYTNYQQVCFSADNWRYINPVDSLLTDTSIRRTPL